MAYAVVRTDEMSGVKLESVKYMGTGSTATAIENGNVVLLDGLMTGEEEVVKAVKPAANSALKDIVVVATPEVMYDERKHNLTEFRNEAGGICRGYHLETNKMFSVTKDALAGNATPEVGDIVELKADTKLNVVDSLTSGSTQVGTIWAVDVVGSYTYYVIKIA